MDSFVPTPRRNDEALRKTLAYMSANVLKNWRKRVHFTKGCESAGFMRRVCWNAPQNYSRSE